MADDLQRVGLVFKADGAIDFKKSLTEINSAVQVNRSEFKLAKSTWDDSTKSQEKLKATQKYLASQTKDYSDKVILLKSQLKELESAENKDTVAIEKKKAQLNTATSSLNSYKKGLGEVEDKLKNGKARIDDYVKSIEKVGEKAGKAGDVLTKGVTLPLAAVGAAGIKSAMDLDDGYDTIIQKTGATGDKLEDLNEVADNVFGSMPVDMTDVGTAVGELNTRFGFTGDKLQGATEQFLKFAEVNGTDVNNSIQLVARAMGDAGIDSSEYSTVLDQLTSASQNSGIGVDELAGKLTQFGAPMRALGFDTESSIAIFSQWEKAGVNTETAFGGMKKAIGNWTSEGKDAKVEFGNFVKGVQDGSVSSQEALEMFGQKAGTDMVDAIKGGRFNYEEFVKVVQNSKGTLGETYDNMLDPWDKFKVVMNQAQKPLAELGTVLIEAFLPALAKVSEVIKKVTKWFGGLSESQKKMIVTIGLVVAAIGPALSLFSKLAMGIKLVAGALNFLLANPIVLAIAAVIAIIVVLWTKCEWFRDGVKAIWEAIKVGFSAVVDWFKTLPETFAGIWTGIKDGASTAWNKIAEFFSAMWTGIGDGIKTAWNGIKDFFVGIWTGIKDFFVGIWTGIKGAFVAGVEAVANFLKPAMDAIANTITTVWTGIKNFFSMIWNGIKVVFTTVITIIAVIVGTVFEVMTTIIGTQLNIMNKIVTTIWNAIKGFIMPIVEAIKNAVSIAWNAIKDVTTTVFTAVRDFFVNTWNGIKTVTTTVFTAIKDFFVMIWTSIVEFVTPIIDRIKNTITNVWNDIETVITTVFNAVSGFIKTVWNGIVSAVVAVITTLKNTITNIWNGIKSVTSTVFNAVKNVVTSVWDGIKNGVTTAVNAVKDTVSNIWNGIKSVTEKVWNGIKDAIMTPINAVKNLVGKAINAIKGFFDFKISWPHIPMPHFGISPSGWKVGDLLKGSIPHLSIKWNAEGGILNHPSIIGANGNQLLGAGEAGAEAIIPISKLKEYIREENANSNASLVSALKEAFTEVTLHAVVNVGDKKLTEIMTKAVSKSVGTKQAGWNMARGTI